MLGVMVMVGTSKAVVKAYGCAPHMYRPQNAQRHYCGDAAWRRELPKITDG